MKLTPKEKLIQALLRDRRYKFRELQGITGLSKDNLNALIAECRRDGLKVVYGKLDRTFFLSHVPTPYTDGFDMSWLPKKGKLGLISDTHLCSNAERLDLIEKAYDQYTEEGINTVLHTGDIVDGWEVYRGHSQNVKVAGVQSQAKYVIDNYPHRDGIRTYFITGNHCNKAYEKQGVDIGSLIVNGFDHNGSHVEGRKDLVYLGQYSRMLNLPNEVTIQLLHPHGGTSYARSYPQQKRSREMRSDDRPAMQLSGHYHQFCWIVEDYTHMIALPGLQDATEFFVRLGFPRQMGFCVMEYELDFNRFKRVKVEHIQLL